MRRVRGLAVLALLAAAATAGAAGDEAPARPAESEAWTRLVLRVAPPGAAAFADGAALALEAGPNGSRVARLPRGARELLLLADGCVARKIPLGPPAAERLVEAKLERAGSALILAASGTTGPRPKSVAFAPDGRVLVAPLLSGRGADLLDAATLEKLGELAPPPDYARAEGFVECAFFPAFGEVWISQMHNSTIHVFDLGSRAWKASFPSGGGYPKVIAASPDGERAYVTNWVSEDLTIFDVRSRRLLARVKLGGTPRGLAPSPDGKHLYVASFGDGAILRLRLADLVLEPFWPADGGAKRSLVLDAARGRLYATDMDRGSLFVLDTATGTLVAELALGWNPNGCALSPDGRYIFAVTRGPNGAAGYERPGPLFGELVAVDAERLEVAWRQWGGNQPTGLAVSPDGRRIVFTDFLDRRVEAYDFRPGAARPESANAPTPLGGDGRAP